MNIAKHMEAIFVVATVALCALSYQPESIDNNVQQTASTTTTQVRSHA